MATEAKTRERYQENLVTAAALGNVDAVKRAINSNLIDPDAKIKITGEDRSTLHVACGYGKHEVVAELLKAGADPCLVSDSGRTPLHDACQGGHVKCVELLTDFDVDLDCQDKDGMAPIHVAAYHGELDCLKFLAERGADTAIINTKGQEPSHLAVMRNQVEIIKYLFEKSVDLESKCFQGKQPLHYAAQYGSLGSVVALVERNCDIDIKDNMGCVPAHLAAKMDKTDCLRFLVKQGCTLDMTQSEGKTFAHLAAQNGAYNALHWILEKQYNPNSRDGAGNTVGHCASMRGHAECFNCFVQHGGELSLLNDQNETPLQSGRRHGSPVKLEKAMKGEIQCPKCLAKNKRLDWEFEHRLQNVEIGIKQSGSVAYTNPVPSDRSIKNRKPKIHTLSSAAPAKGRESQASNISNLFITEGNLPVRDLTTRFYGQHLSDPDTYKNNKP